MNNKILEEFQAYNNGGIYNEPISSYLPIFTSTNTSTGFGPIMTWPKPNIVELQASETINTFLVHQDPSKTEEHVRRKLAQQLAEKLIEEDIIQIYSNKDVESGDTHFRARIKVIQE